MSLINVQNLTFAYDGSYENVFENVSFQLDTDWKTGLVGRNGRGKTTFLRLLTGEYEYSGKITASVEFTYFPFDVINKERLVLEILSDVCPNSEDWEIIREFSYLQIEPDVLYSPFSNLSNGEQTKVLIAGLFLRDNNFLLIDEPTNHLDISARQTVAKYLGKKKGFILVSHDRAFLDSAVDHILSINRSDIELQTGDFSSYLKNFNDRQAAEAAQNERLKKDIDRLSESAKRASSWADKTEESKYGKADSGLKKDKGYVGHKAAKMMKKAKVTEARAQKAIEEKSMLLKNTESSEELKLHSMPHSKDKLVALNDVNIFYGERSIFSPVTFSLEQGERVALEGKNGSGKSSILKLITGADVSYTGSITLASGLRISYVPQSSEDLSGSFSDYAKSAYIDESLFKTVLIKMGLSRDDFDKDTSDLSEGQKRKILLSRSLCERAHLYIWDEPLNFLDIYSRLQIESLIRRFDPTMIFVEHDKAFREAVATKIIRLE